MWWEHLYIAANTNQGIYYQVDGLNPRTLSVEYLLSDASGVLYQVIVRYQENIPGVIQMYYFTDGDHGINATVGVQGTLLSGSKWRYGFSMAKADLE